MSKTIRKIFLPLLCLVMVFCLTGVTACKKTKTYTVTVAECENGTVTSDKAEAEEGETVTLTVTPDDGYELDVLKVGETETQVSDGIASFSMPAENVTVSAVFKKTGGNTDLEEGEYAVTLGSAAGVTVTSDKQKGKEGDKINLTVSVSYGYKLTSLKLNGSDLTVDGGAAQFTMPAAEAKITVASALSDDVVTAPECEGLTVESRIIRDTATSVWNYEYTETALEFSAYVKDGKVNGELDSVELYVGRFGYAYAKLGEYNFGVKVSADGTVEHFVAEDGEYKSATESAITVLSANPWSIEGTAVDGYIVKLSVSYAKLGIEGTATDGTLCALPALNNYTDSLGSGSVYNGYEKTNAGAYLVLKGGKWEENYYLQGAGVLGGTSAIPAGSEWDLTEDYPAEDTENYENRKVVLNGHDGNDNNLVFFRNEGKNVYARATFKAIGVIGDEKFGKFGLMLFDGNGLKSGLLFYADAAVNDKKQITGTDLGVVPGTNDYNWSEGSSTSGIFDSSKTITLSVAYVAERAYAYFYYSVDGGEETLLTQVRLRTSKDVTVGFKSFAITLEVTDYYCTNNLSEFEDKLPEMRFEGNTLGSTDNYDYGANWVIDKDYAKDSDNYGERMVELTGHDGKDNNIYFKETEGKESYVRATFKLTQAYAGEKWGKFGFMLFDNASATGTFFYVDAWIGDANDGVFRGRQLGYNYAPNGWGNWNTLIKAGDVFDLDTKTITLAMTYADNVVSMYYENANGEDVLVHQCVYAAHSDKFIMGIKSFAYGMQVTDYHANTDKTSKEFMDHNPEVIRQDIDVLVAGDSYTEFWMNYGVWDTLTYDLTTAGKKLTDVGVGGTQVPYWNNDGQIGALQMSYNPENIVFHIGVNDIDSPANSETDAKNAQAVYDRLVGLFNSYHAAFPEAKIFWVGLIPNNFHIKHAGDSITTYNAAYKLLNDMVKEHCETTDYLNYIDQWTSFANEDGEIRANLMMNDGLHLNPVYGYPLWTANIKKALYPDVTADWDKEEYELGASGSRVPTPAWTYGQNGNIAQLDYSFEDFSSKVNIEENIYYKAAPAAQLLFEAEIRSNGRYWDDQYSKIGVSLVNEDVTIFGYFETAVSTGHGTNVNYASLVARGNHRNDWNNGEWGYGVGDWNWDHQAGAIITERDVTRQFSTIGIAKLGSTIYLLIDGKAVTHISSFTEVTEESKFTAGVTTFSRNVEIKTVHYTSIASEVELAVATSHDITVPDYSADGVTVELNKTTAKKTENITFTINNTDPDVLIDKVYMKAGEDEIELVAEDGVYSFTMPDADVSIRLTFIGKVTITPGDYDTQNCITISHLSVVAGRTVTFTPKTENIVIAYLYYEGADGVKHEIVPQDGVFSLEVNEDITVTGWTWYTQDGYVLDGVMDEDYGTTSTEAKLSDNRNMQVWAKKTESGVFIYAMSHSNEYKDDNETMWWDNSNFEFYLNNGEQKYVNSRLQSSGSIQFGTSFKKIEDASNPYNGKWENVYEIFVDKAYINGFDDGDIQLNYAFKTGNGIDKAGYASDYIICGSVHENWDWWAFHAVGGASAEFWTHHFVQGRINNLFISEDGIKIVKAQAQNGTIDGNLDEYADKGVIHTGNATTAVDFTGYVATDGLYLGLTIYHGEWSQETHEDWSWNDNLEIQLDAIPTTILFLNGQLVSHSAFSQSIAVDGGKAADGRNITYVELFMPTQVPVTQVKLQAGLNGKGFNGWQELMWGGYFVNITADGIAPADLDGEFDDAIWTQSVKDSSINTSVNGASISVMGVKASSGVMLGFTVTHTKGVNEACQGDGTQWWNYMGPEIRLFGQDGTGMQIACSAHNLYKQFCYFGTKTVDNGDGTFTTTYEIYIPYYFCQTYGVLGDTSANVALAMAGVYETGWALLFGSDNWSFTHYVTDSGIIAA